MDRPARQGNLLMACALARAGLHRADPACAVTCGERTVGWSLRPCSPASSASRWQTVRVHFRGAVLLVGLLAGVLLPAVAPASLADPAPGRTDTVSARLYPPVVTAGEPAVIAGRVTPVDAGADVVLQQEQDDGGWQTVSVTRTDARGRYDAPLSTSTATATRFRVVVSGAVILKLA